MAEYRDAAAGWEIYRNRNGRVSKEAVNAALGARGFNPIADRTYKHFAKLLLHGYHNYLSINRLDIKHSNDSVFDTADRSRYVERDIATSGVLFIPRGRETQRIAGSVMQVSDGFATIRTSDRAEGERAANASKYNRGVLVFDQVGVERAVEVVEGVGREDGFDLLLSFRSLLETDRIIDGRPLPSGSARVLVNLGPNSPMPLVLSSIHRSFDLMETSRGITDLLVGAAPRSQAIRYSSTPRIEHLEVSNPLEIIILGSVAAITTAAYIVNKVTGMVGQTATVASQLQGINHEKSAEQRREERHSLEMQSMQLDNVKKAIEVQELVEEIRPGLESVLGVEIPQLDEPTRARLETLKDQAVDASVELSVSANEPISIEQNLEDDEGSPKA